MEANTPFQKLRVDRRVERRLKNLKTSKRSQIKVKRMGAMKIRGYFGGYCRFKP